MLIDFKNVSVSRDGKAVLSGVDFHADEGEFIYLTGRVGSGKTTLLKTFYAELQPDETEGGSVATVLGRDMLRLRRREVPALRREMGIVFQDFQLLADRTVERNLEFVLKATGWKRKDEISERVHQVLNLVGMEGTEQKMPHELSGGEQQRVAIARALLNEPKIIIADEPTANLDPETARSIIALLKDACTRGATVVTTTHNPMILQEFPGIVYRCEDGTLKCQTQSEPIEQEEETAQEEQNKDSEI